MPRPVEELINLGPVSGTWLRAVGIATDTDLKRTGAVKAYQKVRDAGYKPSRNLLYALIGAIHDIHWTKVSRAMKEAAVQKLDL